MNYRFSLDKSSPTKLFECLLCKHRTLKRYRNNELNEYLPDSVGRCNREVNCGYHLTPKQYFEDNGMEYKVSFVERFPEPISEPTYIDHRLVIGSVKRIAPNHFIQYLNSLFKEDITQKLVEKFHIGTSIHWEGASIFWQIDDKGNVRTGKIMLYDALSGKRVKKPFNHIQWVHTVAKWKDFQLKQCLFGVQQINLNSDKTIGIVESEKTAILLTAIYPKMIWLACGGMNLSLDSFKPLKDRKIILYPDAGIDNGQGTPFEKWSDKADKLIFEDFDIMVSKTIERVATLEQRTAGYDLADYLIKTDQSGLAITEGGYPAFWDL